MISFSDDCEPRKFDPLRDEPSTPAEEQLVFASIAQYVELEACAKQSPFYSSIMARVLQMMQADDPELLEIRISCSERQLLSIIECPDTQTAETIAQTLVAELTAASNAPSIDISDDDI